MKRQFGRYVIADDMRDELGRGGFARVYRAWDPKLERYVAVKVFFPESDPEMLKRFGDEGRTAANLVHENIVKVHDSGDQDDMPYLVMELLEGETLEKVIKSRMVSGHPMQLLDEVEIMFQVAKGLQYAHARNVIHRDIKPGNIMVLPNGAAKVMDFGIARVMDKGTRRTRQGDIAGTFLYLAPEQFKNHDADKGTDIFSYADVYYELLTGEHPFFGNDSQAVMVRIMACDPPPIRERLPECPAALEAMIQRLMSKDPEIRPNRLEDVIFDTQPILQRLREERVAVLVAEIPALIEAGDLERGQAAIGEVLGLDPLNSAARHLREQLLEEDHRKTNRTKAQALARKGEEHVAARRFSEAVQCFERACALDRSDASLRDRLDEAKLSVEKVHGAARLLSEAREEIQQGRLEAALQKSEQALGLDPGNQAAAQFGRDVRQQIGARRDAAALVRAEQHRSRGEYGEALAVLDGIEGGSAAKTEAAILRGRVEKDRADAERRRRRELFERGLSKAREALVSHRLDEAIVAAEALCAEYPEEPAAADFLSEVREHLAAQRRMEAVGKIMQAARGLINEERFADARSLIERGLRSYPGDAGLSRLLQAAAALGAAQERARQIGRVVEQTYSLAAERRLYDALLTVENAIAEFGDEPVLAQRQRDLELECAQAEYAAGLRKTIEGARRLLAAERPADAAALLEDAKFRFPGELDLADLLATARAAVAAQEERGFVPQTLSRIAALEKVEQFEAAMAQVEAALARYPANADLRAAAGRLRQKLQEQERRRMLTSRIGRIEAAIQSRDWARASAECQDAVRVFPGEEALAPFPARIQEGQRKVEIQLLQLRVQASLRRQDLDDAERQLAAAREIFSQEAVWQDLWQECQSRKQYRDNLAMAENARGRKDYAHAEEILKPLLAGAPDESAANLLGEVVAERRIAAENARREDEDRRRREAEEARREHERAAIAKGRAEAADLARKADYQAAIALLDQLAGQYPADAEIQQDREAARREWERQRREAEEQARRQAIVAGRQEAAELLRNGDSQGAIAILDRLGVEYPDAIDIRQDREAAVREWERRRRETEEQARGRREQAIAAGRQEAAELLRNGDSQGAIAILDRLSAQFPEAIEIRQDREAALGEGERQRREAEEHARQQAISAGRQEAADLLLRGDLEAAIAIFDHLGEEYPNAIEIRQDREAAVHEEERQQREAEEQARSRREQAIAAGRQEAAELLRSGDSQGAIAILDRLGVEYPDAIEIRQDREAAVREGQRQRREAEEQARRERERAAIAEGRAKAAVLVRQGSHQTAVALLDQLDAQYPGDPEIRKDREAAWREWERQRREAEEQSRSRREQAIAAGRQEAAELLRNGDSQGAIAILDRLGVEYPDAIDIRQDREAAVREGERQRREAEEQARRERELVAVAQGRNEAAGLMQSDDYQEALALLERLALQFPGDPDIEQDRKAAAEALRSQHREAEKRAKRALDAVSARRRREPGNDSPQPQENASKTLAGEAAARIQLDRESAGKRQKGQRPEAEQRAKEALAAFSAKKRTGAERGNGEARNEAAAGARAAGGETTGHQTSGTSYRPSPGGESVREPIPVSSLSRLYNLTGHAILTARNAIAGFLGKGARAAAGEATRYQTSDGESVPKPIPVATLGRLYGFTGHAILTVRNAIAGFLGKGDRRVAVPILDRSAAAALDWIARRRSDDLALLTARDELINSLGRSPASRGRLAALAAGVALLFLILAYFAVRAA